MNLKALEAVGPWDGEFRTKKHIPSRRRVGALYFTADSFLLRVPQRWQSVQLYVMSSVDGTKRAELMPPPPKPTASFDAPPCVLDIPPGVIANVGTFLSNETRYREVDPTEALESAGTSLEIISADLMTLCVVFGSKVARTVRKVYLEYNMDYLEDIRDLANDVAMDGADEDYDENPKAFRKWLPKIRARLEAWMSENEWWRDAAKLDPAYHEDNAAEAGVPVIFKTIVLTDFETEHDQETLALKYIEISSSGQVEFSPELPLSPDSAPRDVNYSIVISVNGAFYTSFEEGKSLLLREDSSDKRLQVVNSAFAEMFLNPALIIDLGLLDVLKFQMEELKLDVNYQHTVGIYFRGVLSWDGTGGFQGRSLLFHALAQPDQRLFDYLLSLQGIEANPVLKHSLRGQDIREFGATLLHEIPSFADYPLLDEEIDLISRLRRVLEREDVDVNCRGERESTPLEELCEFWADRFRRPRLQCDLARLYLSVGAGELERAKESLEDFLLNHELRNDAEEYCRKLIDLLNEAEER